MFEMLALVCVYCILCRLGNGEFEKLKERIGPSINGFFSSPPPRPSLVFIKPEALFTVAVYNGCLTCVNVNKIKGLY